MLPIWRTDESWYCQVFDYSESKTEEAKRGDGNSGAKDSSIDQQKGGDEKKGQ